MSAKQESLALPKDVAEDWYLELMGKHRRGELKNERTFRKASDQFLIEYETITDGGRSAAWYVVTKTTSGCTCFLFWR